MEVENIEFFQNLLPTLKQVFKKIYAEREAKAVDVNLFEKTKNKFWAAIRKGYATNKLAGDTPLIRSLQTNLVTFTLFKNHQNMQAVASLLVDDSGKARSYEEFEAEALKVSVEYNKNWLQAEYDTAVKASQSASQWVQIQEQKDKYPYLLYVTQHDERVRHEHETFDGTCLPVGHSWWRTHFPPNGFRCRCHVRQLTAEEAEEIGITKKPDREELASEFNFNAGITGEIFNEGHTYFKDVPEETIEALKEFAKSVKPSSKWW